MLFRSLGPYLNAGVSNNASVVGEAQSAGIGRGKLIPGQAGGNLLHLESGLEFDLGHSVSLIGSAYGVFASVASTTTATPATPLPRRGPRGRLLPPAAKTQAVNDVSDASDDGIGGALWAQLTESLGLGLWLSHSIRFSVTTVSLSANVSFAAPGRRNRPHQ